MHTNSNNDREPRDNSRPINEAQTSSYIGMTNEAYKDEPDVSEAAIDPLSRVCNSHDPCKSPSADWSHCKQILQRTNTQHKIPQALYANASADAASGVSESDPSAGRLSSEPANFVRRGTESSVSNKLTKEKDKK